MKQLLAMLSLLLEALSIIAAEQKIVLQPGSSGTDMYFGSVYDVPGVNNQQLRVGGWGDTYATLIKFTGVEQPLPYPLKRAELWLYRFGVTSPTDMYAYRLTTPWSESIWDHQNLAGYYIGKYPGPLVGTGWYGLDVTGAVNAWRVTPSANYGWCFLPVGINNQFNTFYSSDCATADFRPKLYLIYDVPALFTLKWPLATTKPSTVNLAFGADWVKDGGDGKRKKHTGTDYPAAAGTKVYAAEAGYVKTTFSVAGYANVVVIEHNNPRGGKFCTIYWHINSPSVTVGQTVTKGQLISSVASLIDSDGHNYTHFHFGLWNSSYVIDYTAVGALPQTRCADTGKVIPVWPAYPSYFIDPNSPNNVLFQ